MWTILRSHVTYIKELHKSVRVDLLSDTTDTEESTSNCMWFVIFTLAGRNMVPEPEYAPAGEHWFQHCLSLRNCDPQGNPQSKRKLNNCLAAASGCAFKDTKGPIQLHMVILSVLIVSYLLPTIPAFYPCFYIFTFFLLWCLLTHDYNYASLCTSTGATWQQRTRAADTGPPPTSSHNFLSVFFICCWMYHPGSKPVWWVAREGDAASCSISIESGPW